MSALMQLLCVDKHLDCQHLDCRPPVVVIQVLSKYQMRCRRSANQELIKCIDQGNQSQVSIKGIDQG